MAVTIGSVDLGKIQSMNVSKSETISTRPKITKDSDEAIGVSISGALRTVNIKGRLTASSIANLLIAITNIEALIDGNQTSNVVLNIDVEGTTFLSITVKINSFTWKYEVENRAVADYNLEVVENE